MLEEFYTNDRPQSHLRSLVFMKVRADANADAVCCSSASVRSPSQTMGLVAMGLLDPVPSLPLPSP